MLRLLCWLNMVFHIVWSLLVFIRMCLYVCTVEPYKDHLYLSAMDICRHSQNSVLSDLSSAIQYIISSILTHLYLKTTCLLRLVIFLVTWVVLIDRFLCNCKIGSSLCTVLFIFVYCFVHLGVLFVHMQYFYFSLYSDHKSLFHHLLVYGDDGLHLPHIAAAFLKKHSKTASIEDYGHPYQWAHALCGIKNLPSEPTSVRTQVECCLVLYNSSVFIVM